MLMHRVKIFESCSVHGDGRIYLLNPRVESVKRTVNFSVKKDGIISEFCKLIS